MPLELFNFNYKHAKFKIRITQFETGTIGWTAFGILRNMLLDNIPHDWSIVCLMSLGEPYIQQGTSFGLYDADDDYPVDLKYLKFHFI